MKQDLTAFMASGPQALKILVIESVEYLPRLRKLYPNAKLTAVTRYADLAELADWASLDVKWQVFDYRLVSLNEIEGFFDIIVAENALTEAYEPYENLMAISRKLTDVGTLYTSFLNMRYQGFLHYLQLGELPIRQHHCYVKKEIVKLLDDTLFKEIHFLPGKQDDDLSAANEWQQHGFDNFSNDLATTSWLVKACRSTAAVANLKGLYDVATRKRLSQLLHRLEYEIETTKNLAELQKLCEVNMIFPEYLVDFINEACVHKERVNKYVAKLQF